MNRVFLRVARALQYAACVPLLLLIAITTADVAARYLLRSAVPDANEISGMMLGLVISLGLASTMLNGEQVRFDMVLSRFRGKVRVFVDALNLTISLAVFTLISWQAARHVMESLRSGEYIGAMEIPLWPAKAAFALCCGLTAAGLAAALLISLTRYKAATLSERQA